MNSNKLERRASDLAVLCLRATWLGCGLTLLNRTVDVSTTRGAAAFPDPREYDGQIMNHLRKAPGAPKPGMLRIHDYILAKTLGCESAGSGGCRAANSIAFIVENETVFPCESLVLALGDLYGMEMESIWSSHTRQEILEKIGSLPLVCQTCEVLDTRRGGCSGAAFHLTGHHDNPDPVCPCF